MRKPSRFVSTHNHTCFSAYDGLGYPSDHFEFAYSNGIDAYAITEHGNFNSLAHAQLFVEEWKKGGKKFKFLPGIEAYFHPDLEQWKRDKETLDDEKELKKLRDKELKNKKTIITQVTDGDDETLDIEMKNALTIEDEDASKSTKSFNPINRRHHLVLLPKNDLGLQQLFHLTSRSFLDGFYRFPRIDVRMIKNILKGGNVIAQSACIGGLPAFNIFRTLEKIKFDDMNATLLNDPILMGQCVTAVGNAYEMMIDCFGQENYFLELQFNKLPAQDLVNRAIIQFARQNGLEDKLTVAGDAHYYNPDVWKERELYKKLGFMGYKSYSPDDLPKSKDDLKCELYPKNADQIWEKNVQLSIMMNMIALFVMPLNVHIILPMNLLVKQNLTRALNYLVKVSYLKVPRPSSTLQNFALKG
jgi:DNA polymerase-3 subunit alpha